MLRQFGDDARLLAGGHSLIPMMKFRLATPTHLIDIGAIGELSGIREEGGKIVVGSANSHHLIETSDLLRRKVRLLCESAAAIGDVQVRNRGTIGGSLSQADPAADYPAAILALEGEMTIAGESGARTVKAEDFFVDLLTTAIQPGEILTAVSFAPIAEGTGCAYLKYRQPASGFAIVGVAAMVTLDKKGNFRDVRVGVTGLCAKAFRAGAVESALAGKGPDAIASAASQVSDGADPLGDIHASSDFRAELARVYTRRAIEQAAARAKS